MSTDFITYSIEYVGGSITNTMVFFLLSRKGPDNKTIAKFIFIQLLMTIKIEKRRKVVGKKKLITVTEEMSN